MTGNGGRVDEGEIEPGDPLVSLEEALFVHEPQRSYEAAQTPRDFRDLRVFTEARTFVKDVYSLSASFPPEERFGLTDQLRRASVSIVANIAEGNGRQHPREYVQFLSIAMGSARECQALLILAEDLGCAESVDDHHERLDRLVGMLHRLRAAIRTQQP